MRSEVLRSPMYDLKEMRSTNGKLVPTDSTLLPTEMARDFPDAVGVSLLGQRVRLSTLLGAGPSAVFISYSSQADQLIDGFRQAARARCKLQIVSLHLSASRLKHVLTSSLVKYALRSAVPWVEHGATIVGNVHNRDLANIGAHNRYGGYVYLTDSRGRARWRASGAPEGADIDTFINCAEQLVAANQGLVK